MFGHYLPRALRLLAVVVAAFVTPLTAEAGGAGGNALRSRWTADLKEYAAHTSYSKYYLAEIDRINRTNADSVRPAQLAASYYQMCRKFTERGEFLAEILFARHMYNELGKTAGGRDCMLVRAKYANSAALSYTALKFYDEARKMFDAATAIARKHGFNEVLAQVYTNRAQLYYDTGEYDAALRQLSALKRLTGGDGGILYNNMALVYLGAGRKDSAAACFDKALAMAGADSVLRARILVNKGSMLTDGGYYSSARACLKAASRLVARGGQPVLRLMLHLNTAQLYICEGRGRQAAAELDYIERSVMPGQADAVKGKYLKEIASLYIKLDDYARASRCLQESIRLNDSLNYDNQKRQLFQLLTLYDISQLRNDNLRLKGENELARVKLRNRSLTAAATIAVAALLSVLVVVTVRKRRNERRQNAVIREQEQMLYRLRQKEYEREKSRMESELGRKSRELTMFSIDLSSIDNLHKSVCDDLAALAAATAEDDTRRRAAAASLKLRKQTAHSLGEDFKKYFGEVSPDFNVRLKEAHPGLMANDLRLCAYIYMGLTSKEISQITFREVESVEKSRNRLRKKMGLDSSVPIRQHLLSIVDGLPG